MNIEKIINRSFDIYKHSVWKDFCMKTEYLPIHIHKSFFIRRLGCRLFKRLSKNSKSIPYKILITFVMFAYGFKKRLAYECLKDLITDTKDKRGGIDKYKLFLYSYASSSTKMTRDLQMGFSYYRNRLVSDIRKILSEKKSKKVDTFRMDFVGRKIIPLVLVSENVMVLSEVARVLEREYHGIFRYVKSHMHSNLCTEYPRRCLSIDFKRLYTIPINPIIVCTPRDEAIFDKAKIPSNKIYISIDDVMSNISIPSSSTDGIDNDILIRYIYTKLKNRISSTIEKN